PTSGSTDASGKVTTTYKSSTTVGTCVVTATDATGASGNTTITQSASALVLTPASQSVLNTATATITATATQADGSPFVGYTVVATAAGPTGSAVDGNTQTCVTDPTGKCTLTF